MSCPRTFHQRSKRPVAGMALLMIVKAVARTRRQTRVCKYFVCMCSMHPRTWMTLSLRMSSMYIKSRKPIHSSCDESMEQSFVAKAWNPYGSLLSMNHMHKQSIDFYVHRLYSTLIEINFATVAILSTAYHSGIFFFSVLSTA